MCDVEGWMFDGSVDNDRGRFFSFPPGGGNKGGGARGLTCVARARKGPATLSQRALSFTRQRNFPTELWQSHSTSWGKVTEPQGCVSRGGPGLGPGVDISLGGGWLVRFREKNYRS